jgi:hypothetical protein
MIVSQNLEQIPTIFHVSEQGLRFEPSREPPAKDEVQSKFNYQ